MKVKLYTKGGGFVTEGMMPDFNEPPEVLIWGERFFIRDPFRITGKDRWVRYTEAWTSVLLPSPPRAPDDEDG